jgi:hypothetical protein
MWRWQVIAGRTRNLHARELRGEGTHPASQAQGVNCRRAIKANARERNWRWKNQWLMAENEQSAASGSEKRRPKAESFSALATQTGIELRSCLLEVALTSKWLLLPATCNM